MNSGADKDFEWPGRLPHIIYNLPPTSPKDELLGELKVFF